MLSSGVADATLIGAASTNDPACGKPSVKLTLGISTFAARNVDTTSIDLLLSAQLVMIEAN